MARFITASKDIAISGAESFTWTRAIDTLFFDPAFVQKLGALQAIDLRRKLRALTTGVAVELTEDEWTALRDCARVPVALGPGFIYADGAEEFFRAILDAPTKNPSDTNT